MGSDRTNSGRSLNRKWQVGASHALYHKDGKWFHLLDHFPGAFFDSNGFLLFKTKEGFENCPHISIGEHVNVRGGISNVPGYVRRS